VAKQGLTYGHRFGEIEKKTRIPGISVILIPVWYMFEHFPPDKRAKLTSLIHKDKGLCEMAVFITKPLKEYQITYD
jgi:hypothetical protein